MRLESCAEPWKGPPSPLLCAWGGWSPQFAELDQKKPLATHMTWVCFDLWALGAEGRGMPALQKGSSQWCRAPRPSPA